MSEMLVDLTAAARRTGMAHNAGAMSRVAAVAGVPVVGGAVDLVAFCGGSAEVLIAEGFEVVATGRF